MEKLKQVKGVGPSVLRNLYENKIFNTYQAVLNTPNKYNYYEINNDLTSDDHNNVVTIKGLVERIYEVNMYSKTKLLRFNIINNKYKLTVLAFNQLYLSNKLQLDEEVVVTGKFNFYKKELVLNKISFDNKIDFIEPIYNLKNIYNKTYNKIIREIYTNKLVNIYETIPSNISHDFGLIKRDKALKYLHFPKNKEDIFNAIKYFKHEEAFNFFNNLKTKVNLNVKRERINYDLEKVKNIILKIPYTLTKDQQRTVNEIYNDFKAEHVNYRLIQGDVGSGKTVVAGIALYGVCTAGFQGALMAPTEILANQHYEYLKQLFGDEYNIELLTSSVKNKNIIINKLINGEIDILIGTHSLASDDVIFKNLKLVIIDEQHKFGVNIRNDLVKKGNADLIYLTATPIPRTLAITMFSEASISIIKEKPKGRKDVITKYIDDSDLSDVYFKIQAEVLKGNNVYIVAPAVTSEHAKYNVNNVFDFISKHINANNIYKIYGSLARHEQDTIIDNFSNNKGAILVSTSMIEVGIDVSHATLMVVFGADFFGLSQLHQLRGRVGRGSLESFCYLIGSSEEKERLKIIESENDGFKLSEYDLKERGPGSFFGSDQTGMIKFKYLNILNDYEIIKKMREVIYKRR